jgi:hypothetical protein
MIVAAVITVAGNFFGTLLTTTPGTFTPRRVRSSIARFDSEGRLNPRRTTNITQSVLAARVMASSASEYRYRV